MVWNEGKNLPLLRLVPSRKQWDGDEDDNCFPAVANLNL